MVIPTLTYLLPQASLHLRGNNAPLDVANSSRASDKIEHNGILRFGPRAFVESGAQNLLPAMKTLYVAPQTAKGHLTDFFPILGVHLRDSRAELGVLVFSPPAFDVRALARCGRRLLRVGRGG